MGAAAFFSAFGSVFFVAVAAAAGLASFFASFTVPEAPRNCQTDHGGRT